MQQVTGYRLNVVHKPARQVDIPVNILDPARARQYLGYEPNTSLETGLLKTWTWLLCEAMGHQLSAYIP
jgi:UDP-glucose 4-epimerase